MHLKMKSTYASPIKVVHAHDIGEFDAKEARDLMDGGFAVEPTKAELEAWRTKQAKTREREKNRDQ